MKNIFSIVFIFFLTFNYLDASECIEGDCRNGKGTFIFSDGAKYIGDFKDGKLNGSGIFSAPNGLKYVGEVKDNRYHGYGVLNYPDGTSYEGQFNDGKYEGEGTYIFADGDRYQGQWKNDVRHGAGVIYIDINADDEGRKGILKYEGNWNNDKRHGKFTKVFRNGDIQKIEYQYGQLVSKEQDINKLKAECNIQKFQDILNCDIETVIQKCDSLIGGGPTPEEYTFTKEPNNTFIRINIKNCKSTFGNIFGMKPNVYAAWIWDKKKENYIRERHNEIFKTKENVNIVLIRLDDLNKDKFNKLYDYLKKNKKSSGSINKTSEVIDGKKNFVLWAFDKSEILLILKPSYLGDGWVGYLAYVRPELVSKIINSFLETDTSNSQL